MVSNVHTRHVILRCSSSSRVVQSKNMITLPKQVGWRQNFSIPGFASWSNRARVAHTAAFTLFRRLRWPISGVLPAANIFAIRWCALIATQSALSDQEVGEGSRIQEADALLQQRFGPQAKIVLRPCLKRRVKEAVKTTNQNEEEEEDLIEEEEPVASVAHFESKQTRAHHSCGPVGFRASATCRLLGFPLELASATGDRAEEVLQSALREALESDVIFIHPQRRGSGLPATRDHDHRKGYRRRPNQGRSRDQPTLSLRQLEFKAIIDELRELCVHFSRVLKFSIRSPGSIYVKRKKSCDKDAPCEWYCRAYVRDEWSVAPSLAFTGEASGQSANDSLMRCFAMLRDRYRSELDSPSVQLESVREVEAFVQPWDKLVESHCFEEGVGEVANEKNGRQEGGGVPPSHASPQKEGESELESEGEAVTVEEEYRTFRPITYTAAVTVEDVHGNINVNRVRRQVTQLSAYQNASWQAIRMEYGLLPDVTILDQLIPAAPLLVRMRWQFDAMVHRLAQQCGKRPEEVACVHIDGDDFLGGSIERGQDTLVGGGMTKSAVEIRRFFFTARFVSDGCVVWQQNGPGRYRLEFDCYVQALTYLLDRHPDVGLMCFDTRGGGVLFPTSHLLELAVQRHDGYNIATNHRGKWNAYAILGTLTSQLIGSFYQTTYKEDRNTGETCAVLTVNDGRRSGQLLIQRQAKRRGEAWRNACLDALRENFPNQYRDALLLHPDIDLSSDTMARGSKYRALPREKRVEHIGNIFSLVAAFAEEDLGWYNLRIRLRNTSGDLGLPQWVAEMEAQVDGEEHRRIVATSPPYPQVRHARRVLLYTVAQKYFPKELEAYAKLNRGDAVNPDLDTHNSYNTVYRVGSDSFLNQVMGLLEECAPSMAPFTWMVEHSTVGDEGEVDAGNDGSVEWLLRPLRLRFRAVVYGQKGDLLISERVGDGDESAVSVLCSVLRAATDRLAGDKGEKLWTEYESHAPPAVATSRELSLYMFNAFFGSSSLTAAEGADVGPCAMEQQVVDIEAREVGGYWFATLSLTRAGCLTVARAVATTKREAVRDVLLLACRRSFQRSLAYLSAHSRETHSFASEILSLPVIEELPDNILRSIWQQLDRAEVTAPPRPYTLLHRCVARDLRNDRWLRVEQQPNGGSGFQCRIYLQKHRRVSKRGEVQLIGFGCAISRAQALHVASVRALENLFEEDLSDAIRRLPTYTDLPPLD